MKKYVLLGILFMSILLGCDDEQTNSSTAVNADETLTTKVGTDIIVRLESNPTTGYSWRTAEFEPGIIEKVSNEYQPYNTTGNVVGSGGTEIWIFKAIKKGKITITFEYVRPWEKDIPPVKEKTYLINVK